MEPDTQAIAATETWRSSIEHVLEFAELAAPVSESEYETLSVDGGGDPEKILDERISRLLADSEQAVAAVPDDVARVSLLLANLEAAQVLTTASQAPDDVFGDLGVDGGEVRFDDARVQISVLQDAALGRIELAPAPLPERLTEKLDELQNAGGAELVDIATSPVVWAAVEGGASGMGALAGRRVKEAFKTVKRALNWLKRAAMRVIEWVVEKLSSLLPDGLREKFDELLDSIKDKLKDSAPAIVGSVLGQVLGRRSVEDAWKALETGRAQLIASRLDNVTKVQLARIGYITTGRKAVDKFEVIVVPVLSGGALLPQLKIVAWAIVAAIVGFVGFQVWDGFREVKSVA